MYLIPVYCILLLSLILVATHDAVAITLKISDTSDKDQISSETNHLADHAGEPHYASRQKRTALLDINCNTATALCNLSAEQFDITAVWKKVCYRDKSDQSIGACSEICRDGSADYHPFKCKINCRDYDGLCSQSQAIAPTQTTSVHNTAWIHTLTCNATRDMCRTVGLKRTEFYNISCYDFGLSSRTVRSRIGSCYDTCQSTELNLRIKCDHSCADYIARCINRSTTRKQTTTRRGEKGIIYSSTIANKGDHGNIPAAAAGSVTGVLVIIVFVLVAVCIARKKKRPIAIAANQVQNAGREMLRSVSETGSSVVAAGSSVVAALKKQFSEGDSPSTREEREPLTTTPLDSVMEILVSDSQETVFTGV